MIGLQNIAFFDMKSINVVNKTIVSFGYYRLDIQNFCAP